MTIYSTKLWRAVRRQIGRDLHEARAKQKLPLEKLSRQTGIPVALLDHYELGKGEIRLDELLRLWCVLGV